MAYLKTAEDVGKLADLQSRLLDAAAKMLTPGGTLLFCTCSLQPEEGPLQATAFLERHRDFQLDRIAAPEIYANENASGMFRSLPSDIAEQGGRDGFFAARFVRR